METVLKINSGLERIRNRLAGTPKRSFLTGIVIYTFLIIALSFPTVISEFIRTGSVLGYDGEAQYFPLLIGFRRSLVSFFESIGNGQPVFPMMDFDYGYGTDIYICCTGEFLPFLPYYIFSVLVPEESMALFYGTGTLLLSYLAGISFIYMCSRFECDGLLAGIFAPLYVLCGNYMFTGLFNQHFLYMYIAMPLFIVGIDRIIHAKSIVLFVMSVFWLSLSGIVLLIYTIPFVVLFALIRVYFVYPKAYFRSVGKYALIGASAFLLGFAMAGVINAPAVYELMISGRIGTGTGPGLAELLIPDARYLEKMMIPLKMNADTGVCAACLPCFLFVLVSLGKKQELKIYALVTMLLVSLPLIRYGLNGFQYSLCRWGFIPALLICFICVKTVPGFLKQDRDQLILTVTVTAVYLLAVCAGQYTAAMIFAAAVSVITLIPPLREAFAKTVRAVRRTADTKYGHLVRTVLLAAAVLGFVIYVVYVIAFVGKLPYPLLTAAVPSAVIAVIAYRSENCRALCMTAVMLFLGVSCVISYYSEDIRTTIGQIVYDVNDLFSAEPTKEFLAENDPAGTFGRVAFVFTESDSYGEYKDDNSMDVSDNDKKEADTQEKDEDEEACTAMNAALRYGYPDSSVFRSTIDSDFLSFMLRCGQDANSLLSRVNMSEFGGKDVIYSLFGIRYMYLLNECDYFYGRTFAEEKDAGEEGTLRYYINEYALPVGVTYPEVMNGKTFGQLDAAELPFAMMNEVYLENCPLSENAEDSGTSYAKRCAIQHEKTSRGVTSFGIECHDNRVTIEDDVSGCYLFISFDGVKVIRSSGQDTEFLTVSADKDRNCYFSLHNREYDWPWSICNDHYTLSLGYFENDVNELNFVSPFEYTDMYVTAVPVADYVSAYNELTRETLRNVRMSGNTLSGDITVSEDKVLSVNLIHNDGWKAFVDGRKVPIYKANGLFLGIPLEKGSHTVEITYITPYLIEGTVLSAVTIISFIAAVMIYRRKKNRAE